MHGFLCRKLHQMRLLERLEGDERLEALLEDLQRRAPDVKGSEYGLEDSSEMSQDLRCASSCRSTSIAGSFPGSMVILRIS